MIRQSLNAFSMALLGIVFLMIVVFNPPKVLVNVPDRVMLPRVSDPQLLFVDRTKILRIRILVEMKPDRSWEANQWVIGKEAFRRDQYFREIVSKRGSAQHVVLEADARLCVGEVLAVIRAVGSAGYDRVFLTLIPSADSPVLGPFNPHWIATHVVG